MSYNRKPFCKICFDAKKPESVYTSHFIRATNDPNSVVTCPILLATECRYCHKTGHTLTHCAERARANERKNQKPADKPTIKPTTLTREPSVLPKVNNNNNNKFALLEEDEEEVKEVILPKVSKPVEAPTPVKQDNEFPALHAAIPRPAVNGWAKTPVIPEAKPKRIPLRAPPARVVFVRGGAGVADDDDDDW